MTEVDELKLLLKELSKKDIGLFISALKDCLQQGYLNVFPEICKKTFEKKLVIEDYEEYILNKDELIEDRYAKYWRMMFELNKKDFDKTGKTAKIYKSLLDETLDRFLIKTKNEKKVDKKRCYIFSNQYLLGRNHSPTLIIDKVKEELINYMDEIFIISTTPYPYPYPDNYFEAYTLSGVEENTIYNLSEKIKLVEFRGYLTESMYFEFIKNENLTNEDIFLLVGHSSLHFDLLPFGKKVVIPTGFLNATWSTSSHIVISGDKEYRNILGKKMNIIKSSTDFTSSVGKESSPKEINDDEPIYIAIVGNRLSSEIDDAFFKELIYLKKKKRNIVFVFIGRILNSKIPNELLSSIQYIEYENDLFTLFSQKIHFYLNPDRLGGGQTTVIAINAAIPVLTLPRGDAFKALHEKYYINNFREIIDFINDYINNNRFKEKIDKFNKEIQKSNKSNFEKSIQEIIAVKG